MVRFWSVCIAAAMVVCLLGGSAASSSSAAAAEARPNIVWILVDDMSANFSCYGERSIETPHVDRMAREGTRFSRAFTTAPVCSPSRSALITGMYQTAIDAHHHRSGRGTEKIHLPDGIEPLPVLFRRAGYYVTSSGTFGDDDGRGLGKTDYNFETTKNLYDGNDWRKRKPGQPFFAQITLAGGKLRGGTTAQAEKFAERAAKIFGSSVKPSDVTLPPYYPRDPTLLVDWAAYLDSCRMTDRTVGELLAELEAEKILDDTIVVFLTDHGISHARGKQFLYDEGIHVPLVVRGPKVPRGAVRDDLVEHIDLAATSLGWAGIEVPSKMQARDLFAANYRPREAIFAARDRCDETIENLRAVRTVDFKYVRNGYPLRPHLQPNNYKDGKSIVSRLRAMHADGTLPALAETLMFSPTRPKEELYDLKADPFETKNLADDPAHAAKLAELRDRLDRWQTETNDHGRKPEAWSRYDSDMEAYVGKKKGPGPDEIRRNIRQMKDWAAAGK